MEAADLFGVNEDDEDDDKSDNPDSSYSGEIVRCAYVTNRLCVPGGWLYRTFFLGGNVAVHTVFVPAK